jgi:hypothetical protein
MAGINPPSGKATTGYKSKGAPVGFVPTRTPMFKPDANGKPFTGKLARTWSLQLQPQAINPIIGFWMPGVAAGAINLPSMTSARSGNCSEVVVTVVASDPAVALSFDMLQNGTSIFASPPVIPANTPAGTKLTFTNLTSYAGTGGIQPHPLSVQQGDEFTFTMIAGGSNWFFKTQLHNAIPVSQ